MLLPKSYTVESVTAGHPDKVCDQISDAILDACLTQDPLSRVAIESFGGHGLLLIGGELTTKAEINAQEIGKQVYQKIGYDEKLVVLTNIAKQSPDIAMGVDTGGAGDQGIMYGFACNETPEFLPKGVVLAHKLAKELEKLRTSQTLTWLKPDGKTQVTFTDNELTSVLVSTQHSAEVTQEQIKKDLTDFLFIPILGDVSKIKILINPTGAFVQGGFEADTGLTGRKIMVDTYGGLIQHGGGCFSGKDATKVDRSAAYMCRFVAKNLVAQGLAKECFVSVAYAIGQAEPVMVTALNENREDISHLLANKFDFKPAAIIERLGLRQPIFQATAAYGHFGKAGLPWEEII